MSKKFFIFLIAACLLCCSAVALASDWETSFTDDNNATYTLKYSLNGVDNADVEIFEADSDAETAAGGNFYARYKLPKLEFYVDFEYDDNKDEYDCYGDFTLSQDKIVYEWEVVGPNVDGKTLTNSNLVYSLDTNNNILIISGLLPELYGKSISYDVVATIKSINTNGLVAKEQNEDDELTEKQLAGINNKILTTIANKAVGTSFDSEITINLPEKSVEETTYTYIKEGHTSFDSFVETASGIDLDSASGDYSVTIKVPFTKEVDEYDDTVVTYTYLNVIAEGDEEGYPEIELPAWLTVDKDSIQSADIDGTPYITSFVIKANTDSPSIKGTKARVRVHILDGNGGEMPVTPAQTDSEGNPVTTPTYLEWDVTCNMASSASSGSDSSSSFSISGTKEVNFVLSQLGESKSQTLTYTGDYSSYEATDATLKALIDKNFFKVAVDKSSKTITLTATAPTSSNTTYPTGTLRFYDSSKNYVDVSVIISVSENSTTLTLSSNPQELELESGGSSKIVTITAAGTGLAAGAGLITWTVKKNDANLSVQPSEAISGSDASYVSRQYTISAPAGISTGDYLITIEAEYGYVSDDIDITVKVKNNGGGGQPDDPQPADFKLTASPSAVNAVMGGDTQTVNITVNGSTGGDLTWTHDSEISGLTVAIDGSSSGATVSVTADSTATEGTHTVTISAQASDSTVETVSFTVIISATALTDAEKYALMIEANSEKILGHFTSITEDLSVSALDSGVFVDESADISELVDSFAELNPAEVPVIALEGITGSEISEDAIYVFPVSYDLIQNAIDNKKLTVGETLLIHVFADPKENNEYSEEYEAYFVDDSGEKITTVPADGSAGINVAVNLETLEANCYYWPVISKYKLTAITVSPATTALTLEPGERTNLKFIANKNVTSWKVSADEDIFSARILKANEADSANLSLRALSNAESGDYDVTVIAYDVDGTSADLTLAVAVKPLSTNYSLKLSASHSSVGLTAGGDPQTVTLTASVSGDAKINNLIWEVKDNSGLIVEDADTQSPTRHQYNISAPSTAAEGAYRVIIGVSDSNNKNARLNLNVVVSSASSVTSRDQSSYVDRKDEGKDDDSGKGGGGDTTDETDDNEEKKQNFKENSSNVVKTSLNVVNQVVLASQGFVNTLQKLASSVGVAALDVSAFSDESRSVNDITEDLGNEEPVLALPIIKKGAINEPKVYVFVIDIAEQIREAINATVLQYNSPIYIRATKLNASADIEVSLSAENNSNSSKGMFLDDEGYEIKTALELLNATNVNAAAYLEPDTDYSIVITTTEDTDTSGNVGPSGAGCTSGSLLGFLAAGFAFYTRKKARK